MLLHHMFSPLQFIHVTIAVAVAVTGTGAAVIDVASFFFLIRFEQSLSLLCVWRFELAVCATAHLFIMLF